MENKINGAEEETVNYRALIDNMLNGYAYCKMFFNALGQPVDWLYIKVNKNFEELVGLKDVEGKMATVAIPGIKESNKDLFEAYGRVAKTGKPEKIETYVEPLKKWFSVSVYCPEKGYFAAIFDVVNEQKEKEKSLEDSILLLKNVIDGCPSPIFLKDLDGKFITINSALEKMLGMSREQIRGKTDYDIGSKKAADEWRANDKKVIDSGKAIRVEENADVKDGHHIFLASKFPLIDSAGRLYGIGSISHDITDLKKAEEQLSARMEEMEKLNKLTVGRELRMVELKERIAALEGKLKK